MKQGLFSGKNLFLIIFTLLVVGLALVFLGVNPEEEQAPDPYVEEQAPQEVTEGIDPATGLVIGEGMNLVIGHCTGCHSAKLITQNRFDSEGWIRVIRWMQETQNLWDLGDSEKAIVDYLSKHYAPEFTGRRMPLPPVEWYELKEE